MVNYKLIAEAIKHYEHHGYKLIEVPWDVQRDILTITANEDTDFEANKFLGRYLVGSAEQSFLHLIINEDLPFGKYCAVTPCFRNDEIDELHQKYFMKLELIHYLSDLGRGNMLLEDMIKDALMFFTPHAFVTVKKTLDARSLISYDIEANGIELGSYGLREYRGINWVYGTGLAEPRLSKVLDISSS